MIETQPRHTTAAKPTNPYPDTIVQQIVNQLNTAQLRAKFDAYYAVRFTADPTTGAITAAKNSDGVTLYVLDVTTTPDNAIMVAIRSQRTKDFQGVTVTIKSGSDNVVFHGLTAQQAAANIARQHANLVVRWSLTRLQFAEIERDAEAVLSAKQRLLAAIPNAGCATFDATTVVPTSPSAWSTWSIQATPRHLVLTLNYTHDQIDQLADLLAHYTGRASLLHPAAAPP
jgi:hypothetical protein